MKENIKKKLNITNYKYSVEKAILELGLDEELILELVEEFVIQIVNSKSIFLAYIDTLDEKEKNHIKLDFTPLRDLAHKNLGVARNLRIDDAQKVLNELMIKDDLVYLRECIYLLEESILKLKKD